MQPYKKVRILIYRVSGKTFYWAILKLNNITVQSHYKICVVNCLFACATNWHD